MVSAVVLAAGESRRMGKQNKLLLPIDSVPLIRSVAEQVIASCAAEVLVVCGYQEADTRLALSGLDVTFAHNPHYAHGLATSIQVGVQAAAATATGFMICLGDLPNLRSSDYNRIIHEFEAALGEDQHAIVRPFFADTPGHPVVFSAAHRTEILQSRNRPGCRNIMRLHPNHLSQMAWENDGVIRDIDTLQDYRRTRGAEPRAV